MSEVFKGRLLLLVTASALALAVVAWGGMSRADEVAGGDDAAVSDEASVSDETGADETDAVEDPGSYEVTGEDPAAGGEGLPDAGFGEEVVTLEVIEGEVGDDVIIDWDLGWQDGGEIIEETPVEEPPVEEIPVEDGGVVTEDGVVYDFGPILVDDGELIDVPVMMQSGMPNVRGNEAPAAEDRGATLPARTESAADRCNQPLVNGLCVSD